jgi:hypothetical protein
VGEIVAAWRSMRTDVRYLHSIDFKWLLLFFLVSAVVTTFTRGITLRRLYRKNRLLRLLLTVQAANHELRRRGSSLQIDTDTAWRSDREILVLDVGRLVLSERRMGSACRCAWHPNRRIRCGAPLPAAASSAFDREWRRVI